MRVMGSAAASVTGPLYAKELGPHQFGGNVSRGSEIISRTLDLGLDNGMTVMIVDHTNAFGEVRLLDIYEKMKDLSPKELRLFRFF